MDAGEIETGKTVCPSQKGMNLQEQLEEMQERRLPLAEGDESWAEGDPVKVWLSAPRRRG